ncbi:hypothetical protein JM79_3213 [Gramella sp. Hel_I_59]|uniref:hypothetical protein n=1 Tax=Gramella sp. Hel_I_59 TaxID=1249978 RepID=UPI001150C14A|nr:hypothetical protein [Gramella sp. Hel_I_59]TQI72256.1 hypothetical protein JM79_3213 [Gramella sp. Hel_I_59]
MSTNIDGLLRNYKGRSIAGLMNDENGKAMSDPAARKYIADRKAEGWKLLPSSTQCEGFDPFGGGCPGHEIKES